MTHDDEVTRRQLGALVSDPRFTMGKIDHTRQTKPKWKPGDPVTAAYIPPKPTAEGLADWQAWQASRDAKAAEVDAYNARHRARVAAREATDEADRLRRVAADEADRVEALMRAQRTGGQG